MMRYKGVGLENFSNNCYLNSIVQIFLHMPELVSYFSEEYESGKMVSDKDCKQLKVVETFAVLLNNVISLKSGYTSPYDLKAAMGKIDRMFNVDEECDAQEFYLAFINALQEGLCIYKKESSEKLDCDLSILSNYKEYISTKRHTIVDRLFLGALGNHVTCAHCNDVSRSYDIFFNIAVSLPLKKKTVRLVLFSSDINQYPQIENIVMNIYTETTINLLNNVSNILKRRPSYKNVNSYVLFTLGLGYVRLARQSEFLCNVVDYDNKLIVGAAFPNGDVGNCFFVRQYINIPENVQLVTVEKLKQQKDYKKKFKSSFVNKVFGKYFQNNSRSSQCSVPPLGSHYVGLPFILGFPSNLSQRKINVYQWLYDHCMKYLDHIDYISKNVNVSFYPFNIGMDRRDFKIIATLKDLQHVIVDKSFELCVLEQTLAIDLVWDHYNCLNSSSPSIGVHHTDNNIRLLYTPPCNNPHNGIHTNGYTQQNTLNNGYVVSLPDRTLSSCSTPSRIISCSSFTDPTKVSKIQQRFSDPNEILADLQIFRSRKYDCTLEECINLFFSETIQISNRMCSKCNNKCDSVCVVKLALPPTILTIQLKRFDYQNGGKKTDVLVQIPKYLTIDPNYIDQGLNPINYRLVGMVCHIGTFSFGHYYTLIDEYGIVDPNNIYEKWILYDDINVECVCEERFIKFKTWAYLLFYKCID